MNGEIVCGNGYRMYCQRVRSVKKNVMVFCAHIWDTSSSFFRGRCGVVRAYQELIWIFPIRAIIGCAQMAQR